MLVDRGTARKLLKRPCVLNADSDLLLSTSRLEVAFQANTFDSNVLNSKIKGDVSAETVVGLSNFLSRSGLEYLTPLANTLLGEHRAPHAISP